jgi:large subunit ribosomal protein L29
MKALKAEDLRSWTQPDLRSRIAELEEERFRLQFRSATEALEEPLRLRSIRKDIARLHTVLNQKLSGDVRTPSGKGRTKQTAAKKKVERAKSTKAKSTTAKSTKRTARSAKAAS